MACARVGGLRPKLGLKIKELPILCQLAHARAPGIRVAQLVYWLAADL